MKGTHTMKPLLAAALFAAMLQPVYAQAPAQPAPDSYEAKSVKAFLLSCFTPLGAGDSVQHVAELQKLPEMNTKAESAFLQGKPGKVYALPSVGHGVVLNAFDQPMCMVLVQKLNGPEFVHQMDYWFEESHSPFHLKTNETTPDGETHRTYEALVNGNHLLLVAKVRQAPTEGGIQGLLTLARTDGKP